MLKHYLKNLEYRFKVIRTLLTSDENYRKKKHNRIFGKELSFSPPNTLNEKINFRMLFQKNDFFTLIADKIAVRDYIELTLGKEHLAPLLGVYDKPESINLEELPDKFVIKCNHDSGSAIICDNKKTLNRSDIIRHFKKHLKRNPYYTNREWQYKNITPRILIEEKIELFQGRSKDNTPEMFRLHCFHGKPHFIEADFTDNFDREYVNIYDTNWKLQPFTLGYPNTPFDVFKPSTLDKMLELACKIAVDFDYCRLDLMASEETVFFSEITLTPESGQLKFHPEEWDEILGKLWNL